MKLSDEQFKALEPFEPFFKTAVNSSWARHPGETALQVIHGIYSTIAKGTRSLNSSCQSCILHLLQDCGSVYFADKAERSQAKTTRKKQVKKI